MKRELAAELIKNFHEKKLPGMVSREFEVKIPESRKALAVIGPRRAGKTYTLYSIASKLTAEGIEKERMLYLNLEDDRMLPQSVENLNLVLETYYEMYPENRSKTTYLFLDEVQNVPEWEKFVRRVMDTEDVRVFLSGSSSKLLAKEIATAMRGRSISHLVLPFSFREFLSAKGFETERYLSSEKRSWMLKHLREYLQFGGFPEVVLEKDEEMKVRILREYFEVMLLRDIVERHGIKSVRNLRMMMNAVLSSFSKEFSVHKFYNTLKSQGIKVSKSALYENMQHFEDAFFAIPVRKFDYSRRNVEQSLPKVYSVDTGYVYQSGLDFSGNIGRYMENAVAVELLRRQSSDSLLRFYYWKDSSGAEIDFIATKGRKIMELIQVSYDMSEKGTEKREINAILKASEKLKCKEAKIITWDCDGIKRVDGLEIKCIPLWKWLVGNEY